MLAINSKRIKKQRALLLYMAGDNNLSDAGLRDVEELCVEGAHQDLYVGVEIDTKGEHTGSIRYEITEPEPHERGKPKAYRKVIDRLSEQDSGKPETLLEFLRWGLRRYPASEYIVVVGGHGSGFRGQDRAIAVDDSGSALDMTEIEYVLRLAGAKKHRLGILGFDACLMGMLEIAHHLSPFAYYLIGSQETEPEDGWPYDKVLRHLKENISLKKAATQMARSYVRYHVGKRSLNVTQSVINLDKSADAMAALSALGEALAAFSMASDTHEAIHKIYMTRTKLQSFRDAEYIDASHMASELIKDNYGVNVTAACRVLLAKLKATIVVNRKPAKAKRLKNANGLSIWFPANMYSYSVNRQKYLEMSGVHKYPGWLQFLDMFFAARHQN